MQLVRVHPERFMKILDEAHIKFFDRWFMSHQQTKDLLYQHTASSW